MKKPLLCQFFVLSPQYLQHIYFPGNRRWKITVVVTNTPYRNPKLHLTGGGLSLSLANSEAQAPVACATWPWTILLWRAGLHLVDEKPQKLRYDWLNVIVVLICSNAAAFTCLPTSRVWDKSRTVAKRLSKRVLLNGAVTPVKDINNHTYEAKTVRLSCKCADELAIFFARVPN